MAGRLRWHWRNVPLPEPHLGLLAGGFVLQWVRPKPFLFGGRFRRVAGWCFSVGGVAFTAWAVDAAGELDLERPDQLVTRGPYAMSRNPMYVGWTGIYLGVALVANMRWPIVLLPMLLARVHVTARAEERELRQRFGDTYQGYARHVRRYL